MTDLEGLEKLKIPSDLTNEQIYEMFKLVHFLTYSVAKNKTVEIIQKRQDDLTAWFMSQNFQHQIVES